MTNVAHADRITTLNKLLDEKGQDHRGIVVTMIHKFRDMRLILIPAGIFSFL
jgi:type I site-specific restriction-modification system R (restriction) subunit